MNQTRYFLLSLVLVLLGVIQFILPNHFELYTPLRSLIAGVTALFTVGFLLSYFTMGVRFYISERRPEQHQKTILNIVNPLLGILLNAIVLYALFIRLYTYLMVIAQGLIS